MVSTTHLSFPYCKQPNKDQVECQGYRTPPMSFLTALTLRYTKSRLLCRIKITFLHYLMQSCLAFQDLLNSCLKLCFRELDFSSWSFLFLSLRFSCELTVIVRLSRC